MFYSITFAPAFERERRFRNDGNVEVSLGRGMRLAGPSDNFQPPGDRREKDKSRIFHRKIWRLKKSYFAAAIEKR